MVWSPNKKNFLITVTRMSVTVADVHYWLKARFYVCCSLHSGPTSRNLGGDTRGMDNGWCSSKLRDDRMLQVWEYNAESNGSWSGAR